MNSDKTRLRSSSAPCPGKKARCSKLTVGCAAALILLASSRPGKAAVLVFDNISNYENSVAGANLLSTSSTPNYFMGDGYLLTPGTTSITGFDIFPGNNTGIDFIGLKINIYVWGNVNLGTVNSGTPAFSGLLAQYTATVVDTFDTGYYYAFEGSPAGSASAFTLGTPLSISGTNIGISFNYQGTTDGVNYVNLNGLTSPIAVGTEPTAGGRDFDGYFRNVNSEEDGNFTAPLRALNGYSLQTLALRVFGTVSNGGNHPPVGNPQTIPIQKNVGLNITLSATDADNDPLTYSVVDYPTNGILTGTPPNLVYTPTTDYVGPDAFTFTANDGTVDSTPALVSLSIAASAGLIINPIYEDSILNDPNAATIMNTIQTAIQTLQTRFANPVTVSIRFAEMNTGLGQSLTYIGMLPYSAYYSALVADSKTTNDTVALAHLTGGASNPVNGGANVTAALPLLRALGFTANPPGDNDSTISLNMSLINLSRPPADPGKYDLQAVVTHEIDEVLGTSSGVGQANIHPVDLFRYTAAGARTFTTAGDDAYFSINGGTALLARYNQNGAGDYGDWWSISSHSPARVQDAFGTPGATPDLGVELTVLDSIGWDLVAALPVSAPVLQPVTLTGTTINLAWSSVANRLYQVQYKTDLTQNSWNNLGIPITASGVITTTTDTISDSQRFYQVALLPLPPTPPAGGLTAAKAIAGPFELSKHVLNARPGKNPGGINIVASRRQPIHIAPIADRGAAASN